MSTKKNAVNMQNVSKTPRKPRFAFSIQKDIFVLHTALAKNPWQTGKAKWKDIQNLVMTRFGQSVSTRALRERIDLLLNNLKSETLTSRTGIEEQKSERDRLLESINVIVEEEKASINSFYSADDDIDDHGEDDDNVDDFDTNKGADADTNNGVDTDKGVDPDKCDDADKGDDAEGVVPGIVGNTESIEINDSNSQASSTSLKNTTKTSTLSVKRKRILKRSQADAKRDICLDEVETPKNKKARLTIEDEMILKRQEHEMMLDIEKINLEKERLALDRVRENRLGEEGRRQESLMQSQMILQQAVLTMMNTFIGKN